VSVHEVNDASQLDNYWQLCVEHAHVEAIKINRGRRQYDSKVKACAAAGGPQGRASVLEETPDSDAGESLTRTENAGYPLLMERNEREIWSLRQMASDDRTEELFL